MLTIENLNKKYGNFTALNNINFQVNNGEIVGLLGENGAGKSTMMRIISTMLSKTSGKICVDGFYVGNDDKEIRKKIGILFGSEAGLYERLSARENIEYFAQLNGASRSHAKKRADELIEIFKFETYANKRAGELSKGMKQKVAIARAVVHDPSVILLDEPESGLDFSAAKIIFDFVETCKAENKTILFSSHSMESIKMLSDRIVVLNKGKISELFEMEKMRSEYNDKKLTELLFNSVSEEKYA